MKRIRVNDISFTYDEEDVITQLSFQIEENEGCILLAGRNGTGKSTLLNLLCGSILPYEGEVDRELTIGYLPFDSPLFEHLTVLDNFRYFYRSFHGKNFVLQEETVQKILQILSIDYLDQRLDKCSSGQKQKAGIAMILMSGADLIVMDEPFVAIDYKSVIGLIELIKEMKRTTAFLITTHTIEQLEPVCDRLILLKKQELQQDTREKAYIHQYFMEGKMV